MSVRPSKADIHGTTLHIGFVPEVLAHRPFCQATYRYDTTFNNDVCGDSATAMMTPITPKAVLDGGRYFEGPRWHSGRLWFVDCMNRTLLSLEPSGEREQHAKIEDDTPCGLGILPDGKLVVLTMFRKRLMGYADGQLSLYADLSGIATGTIDDMIVDGLGRAYVGDLGFDLPPPPDRGAVGRIILVMPDGATRIVADGLRFPNGIAVSAG